MLKPTKEELQAALEEAERMREESDDPYYMSRSLLYLNGRVESLEKVFDAAVRYMKFGQGEHEHAELLKVIEAARAKEEKDLLENTEDFGLE